jgi:hypothetical protein
MIMMIGKIIEFRFPGSTEQKSLNQFCKKFYGQETSSHRGKYRYRRKGLLYSIPHIKPVGGVIVVLNGNADKLIQFLKDYSTELFVRDVIA